MCGTRLIGNAGLEKVAKNRHLCTIANFVGLIFATKAHIDNRKENLLNSSMSSRCLHNMVNIGPLMAEICWQVWDTPANFNGFRVLAALLYGSQVVSISQTLRRWTEGATYVRQGDHHVGHWPTFLVDLELEQFAKEDMKIFGLLWIDPHVQNRWRSKIKFKLKMAIKVM